MWLDVPHAVNELRIYGFTLVRYICIHYMLVARWLIVRSSNTDGYGRTVVTHEPESLP